VKAKQKLTYRTNKWLEETSGISNPQYQDSRQFDDFGEALKYVIPDIAAVAFGPRGCSRIIVDEQHSGIDYINFIAPMENGSKWRWTIRAGR
jgi:hypothetical protein